jgi:hypothetical protein
MADDNAQLRETPFVFVSDRDKGLKEVVKQVFPTNLEFSCAQPAHTSKCDAEVWKKRFQICNGSCQNILCPIRGVAIGQNQMSETAGSKVHS